MGRSDPGLTTSTSEADICQQSRMRTAGSLSLILFGLLVLLALSAVRAEEEENLLSEELAEARVVRSPEAAKKKRRRNGRNGGRRQARRRSGKKNGDNRRRRTRKIKKTEKRRNKQAQNSGSRRGQRRNNRQKPARKTPESRATSGLNDNCFEQAVHFMKVWKDIVGNFEKQRKRMVKQNKTGGNKSGKKGLFAPIAHRLVDIGGGNKSNMSCGGQYGNKGAAQLQNLTKTLFECEIEVNKSCDPANIPQPNMTFIDRCKELVDNFSAEAGTCYDKTYGGKKTNSSDACYCWTHNKINATIDELKTCKANKESAAITAALKNCTSAFGVCRKYEDDASTALSSCASDSSKLTKKAANLAANNASMTAAKEKMASLASSRSGGVGILGSNEDRTAASCAEIITISQTIVKITNQNPQSTKITTYTVTYTAAEKTSLLTEVTSMETAIVSVTTVLVTIQEQIQTLTGSTASTSQLDAVNAETSTAAPAGRRDRIRQQLMAHL